MNLFHQVHLPINVITRGRIERTTRIMGFGETIQISLQLLEVIQILSLHLRILICLSSKLKICILQLDTLVSSMVSIGIIHTIVHCSLNPTSYGKKTRVKTPLFFLKFPCCSSSYNPTSFVLESFPFIRDHVFTMCGFEI